MLASAATPLTDALTDVLPRQEVQDVRFVDDQKKISDSDSAGPSDDVAQSRSSSVNLTVVDAYLIDGNLNRISAPVIGERIGVEVVWNTDNLSVDSSYRMGFFVNGSICRLLLKQLQESPEPSSVLADNSLKPADLLRRATMN